MKLRGVIDPRAFREAASAGVGSITLSLLMVALALSMRAIGFLPFIAVDSLDQRLAQRLAPLVGGRESFGKEFLPVVLIDIDDRSIEEYGSLEGVDPATLRGRITPRRLVVDLLRKVIAQKPAAVLLDLDLRDSQPGAEDEALRRVLHGSTVPVVLPVAVYPQVTSCRSDALVAAPPKTLPTIVDDVWSSPTAVRRAHPYFELDALGYVLGVCASWPQAGTSESKPSGEVHLRAAALEMVAAARHEQAADQKQSPGGAGEHGDVYLMRFRVRRGQERLPVDLAPGERAVFSHVRAYTVSFPDIDLTPLQNALVIVGASHVGADQDLLTAVGPMPGALVHANLAIQAQTVPIHHVPESLQIATELALCLVMATIYAGVYVYAGRRWADRAASRFVRVLRRTAAFGGALALNALVALFFYVVVVRWMFSGGNAYGMLAPLIVIAAEIVFEILKAVTEQVEHLTEHLFTHRHAHDAGHSEVAQ